MPTLTVAERMIAADPKQLAGFFVGGVRYRATADSLATEDLFDVYPAPNWCFQRDPQVVVGDGVLGAAVRYADFIADSPPFAPGVETLTGGRSCGLG